MYGSSVCPPPSRSAHDTPILHAGVGAGLSPRVVCEVTRPSGIKCGTFDAASLAERHLAVGDVQGALAVMCVQ